MIDKSVDSPFVKESLYIIELILAIAVVGYTIIIMVIGNGNTSFASNVAEYIYQYWITQFVVIVMFIPSTITLAGMFLGGHKWIELRLTHTIILIVGMLFLGVEIFLTLGVGNIAWLSFLAVSAISAVCNVGVKVVHGGGH